MAQRLSRVSRTHEVASAIISVSLDKAWKIASDFYGLQKWVPTVQKCYEIRPGIRYVESFPSNGKVTWVKEKLVGLSSARHSITYRIVAGNMGLNEYEATLKLCKTKEGKTLVNWSFGMSTSSTKTKEQQEAFLQWGIQNLEKAANKKPRASSV